MQLPSSSQQPPPGHQNPSLRAILGAVVAFSICAVFYMTYAWWQRSHEVDTDEVKTISFNEPEETRSISEFSSTTIAETDATLPPQASQSESVSIPRGKIPSQTVTIAISGRVFRPGQYHCPLGSRVQDALRMAGGTLADADLAKLNMAAPLQDGMQIVVPVKNVRAVHSYREFAVDNNRESELTTLQTPMPSANLRIDLNNATRQELESLPEVGPVLARRIIEYREHNGGFKSVEELDAVNGIGAGRLQTLRPLVFVR